MLFITFKRKRIFNASNIAHKGALSASKAQCQANTRISTLLADQNIAGEATLLCTFCRRYQAHYNVPGPRVGRTHVQDQLWLETVSFTRQSCSSRCASQPSHAPLAG